MQDKIITIHLLHLPPDLMEMLEQALQDVAAIALTLDGDFLFESKEVSDERADEAKG